MSKLIYVTEEIPPRGIDLLKKEGYDVTVSGKGAPLTKDELIAALKEKPYDAVLCLLTNPIDGDVLDAVPSAKIFANYAVGFNNIDLAAAKARGVTVTNTPDVLTNTVAEHTFALMLSLAHRIVESDAFTRAGKYTAWGPLLLLGTDLSGKTLGVLGTGRIGGRVVHHAVRGFGMKAVYHDIKRNEALESEYGATYMPSHEDVLKEADFVAIHVPLLPETTHLINEARLRLMKKTAFLVNTSRGPVVDEAALVSALKEGVIAGAALDVFEHEPALAPGLAELPNVILTPHTASATLETREEMGAVAARNIIQFLKGEEPANKLK